LGGGLASDIGAREFSIGRVRYLILDDSEGKPNRESSFRQMIGDEGVTFAGECLFIFKGDRAASGPRLLGELTTGELTTGDRIEGVKTGLEGA